jgi:excisionase family DNA binding protein
MSRRTEALENIIFTLRLQNDQLRRELWRAYNRIPPAVPKEWITPKQAAGRLRVTEQWICKLCDRGHIEFMWDGGRRRINPASLLLAKTKLKK